MCIEGTKSVSKKESQKKFSGKPQTKKESRLHEVKGGRREDFYMGQECTPWMVLKASKTKKEIVYLDVLG